MAKDDLVEIEGEVLEEARGGLFKVKLENGKVIDCQPCGKMRQHRIRVVAGDAVTVACSPYDLTKGKIRFRHHGRRD